MNLDQVRELHLTGRRTLSTGIDPMAERKAEAEAKQRQAENSFEKIARKWWEWWATNKSPRHTDTVLRRLEADVFPAYGHKLIDSVGAPDVRELMLAVERREARDVAKRIYQTTGQIFRYAVANGLASRNPAEGFSPVTSWSQPRLRTLLVWRPGKCRSCWRRWTIATGSQSRALP